MTKEEAVGILHRLSEDNFYGNHVQDACKIAIKALSPRPESQEEIIYQAIQEVCHVDNPRRFVEHNQTVFEVAKKALDLLKLSLPSSLDEFQKIEGELVDWYGTSDGKVYCCGIKSHDSFEVPEGFYIRKKKQ